MRDLRHRMTYEQRLELQATLNDLRHYIVPVLLMRQNGVCNICKLSADKYDIDHLVYNPMISLNQLQLLCIPCHKSITDYRPLSVRHVPVPS